MIEYTLKYILLDEIALTLVLNEEGNTIIFQTKEEARKYGDNNINGYQVIEIPFANN